jgi:hypothetical protein
MAEELKPARPARKKRGRKPREEFVDYIVAIEGWDWSYSLSLNSDRRAVDPYHEFRHLEIRGVLHPTGLKTDRFELTLLPSYDVDLEARKRSSPLCVGSLDAYGDRLAGLMSIPADALPEDGNPGRNCLARSASSQPSMPPGITMSVNRILTGIWLEAARGAMQK